MVRLTVTPEQIAAQNAEALHRLNRLAALEAQMDPPPADYRGIIRHWPTWTEVMGRIWVREWEAYAMKEHP